MADGSLSQEDIDALLSGGFGGDSGSSSSGGGGLDFGSSDAGPGEDPFASMGMDGPSMDAVAAALGTGPSVPPPKSQPKTGSPAVGGTTSNLNLLMDVTMSLTVELGRTNMNIKDVIQLSEGALVELDKTVGEELDLLANGKIIGRGKLIVLDDYYGVQVTHIIDPMERLSLG
jgi:flagellar motor switch protein FliN/FliY